MEFIAYIKHNLKSLIDMILSDDQVKVGVFSGYTIWNDVCTPSYLLIIHDKIIDFVAFKRAFDPSIVLLDANAKIENLPNGLFICII